MVYPGVVCVEPASDGSDGSEARRSKELVAVDFLSKTGPFKEPCSVVADLFVRRTTWNPSLSTWDRACMFVLKLRFLDSECDSQTFVIARICLNSDCEVSAKFSFKTRSDN